MAKSSGYDLLVRIEASTQALRAELLKGETGVQHFSRSVNRNLSGIDTQLSKVASSFRSALGVFGVGLSVGGLVNLGRSALQLADNLQDTAAQLGISTDLLQTFHFAAGEAGIEVGTFDQ